MIQYIQYIYQDLVASLLPAATTHDTHNCMPGALQNIHHLLASILLGPSNDQYIARLLLLCLPRSLYQIAESQSRL